MTVPTTKKMDSPKNGSVPNPDPTDRTIEQLQREIATSREIVEALIRGDREVVLQRFHGMDTAIELLQKSADKIPHAIHDAVAHLQGLHDEKFSSFAKQTEIQFDGIATQFQERDKRTEQLSLADKTAIAAALQAQKEAAGAQNESNATANAKMETNFAKLIEQGRDLQQAQKDNTDTQLADIKSRLDKGEGSDRGVSHQQEKTSGTVGLVIAGAVAFTVVMTALVGLVAFVVTRSPPVNSYPATWPSTPPLR